MLLTQSDCSQVALYSNRYRYSNCRWSAASIDYVEANSSRKLIQLFDTALQLVAVENRTSIDILQASNCKSILLLSRSGMLKASDCVFSAGQFVMTLYVQCS